jgi:hypothetical protein
MSKVFTIDQGALGSATITSGGSALGNAAVIGQPRDTDPVWTGDGAAHGAIQTPDAGERNAALTGESSARSAVQSPDATERNAAIIGDPQLSATSVQSPDAIDRNLAYTTGGTGVRDTDPVWIGDTAAPTQAAPIDGSAEESFNAAMTTGGAEPRDTDPTWIGDTAAPEHTYSGDDNPGPDHVSDGDGNLQQP